jgi:hypothetical protein
MRGSAPAAVCLDRWATTAAPAVTEAPTAAPVTATQTPTQTTQTQPTQTAGAQTGTSATPDDSSTTATPVDSSTAAPATAKPIIINESFAAAMAFAALLIHA